jgi:hypothetical protein
VKIIAIEEHWNSVSIRDALDRLPDGARDDSVAFNTMGDNQTRLEDIGPGWTGRGMPAGAISTRPGQETVAAARGSTGPANRTPSFLPGTATAAW